MPVVMAPTSKAMKAVAKFLPSYYVSDGVNQAMFAGAFPGKLWIHLLVLGASSLVMLAASVLILKNKENISM